MRVASAFATGLLAIALLAPNHASAYCLNKVNGATPFVAWKNQPVKYKVSSNLTDAKILKAIDDAFTTWGSVPCSKLKFQKDGTFDITKVAFQDHKQPAILVFWYTAAAGYPTDPKYVAYTFFGHDNAGGLVQASIAVNGFSTTYLWDTAGDTGKLDVHGELVTLIGQMIGLTTSNTKASVMQDVINFGDTSKRTLAPDDLDALHHLYNEAACPAAPAPGANGCTGTAPGPDGSVAPDPDGGTPPKLDGGGPSPDGSKPANEAGVPPKQDTGGTVKFDTGGSAGDGGGGNTCSNSTQCASDEVCTAEGRCVKIGGGSDDSGCCSVAADAPPAGMWLLMLLLGAVWLTTRRRRR
jgi:MYXO-CTERM domain-containing protein